jgi:hypothetical protein
LQAFCNAAVAVLLMAMHAYAALTPDAFETMSAIQWNSRAAM